MNVCMYVYVFVCFCLCVCNLLKLILSFKQIFTYLKEECPPPQFFISAVRVQAKEPLKVVRPALRLSRPLLPLPSTSAS